MTRLDMLTCNDVCIPCADPIDAFSLVRSKIRFYRIAHILYCFPGDPLSTVHSLYGLVEVAGAHSAISCIATALSAIVKGNQQITQRIYQPGKLNPQCSHLMLQHISESTTSALIIQSSAFIALQLYSGDQPDIQQNNLPSFGRIYRNVVQLLS